MTATDAECVKRPKLPKKRLLGKPRKADSKATTAFNSVEGTGNRSKKRTPRFKFCPKCGSTNIFWASGLAQLWSIWECRNCGYRGAFIVEDGEMAKIIQGEYARKAVRP